MPTGRERVARGTLSRQVIAAAAVAVLDREGMAGLTTRAIARELGTDPTALYRHFRDKTDLLRAVGDRLLAEVEGPRSRVGWRRGLEELAGNFFEMMTRHRGAAQLFALIPYSSSAIDLLERVLAFLIDRGLRPDIAADGVRAVVTLVFGHASQQSPDTDDGFWAPLPASAHPAARYPAIHATEEVWSDRPRALLDRDLKIILDGIAVRVKP